jgi:hypothetical protein
LPLQRKMRTTIFCCNKGPSTFILQVTHLDRGLCLFLSLIDCLFSNSDRKPNRSSSCSALCSLKSEPFTFDLILRFREPNLEFYTNDC